MSSHLKSKTQPGTNSSRWIKWMDKQTDGSHYSEARRWFLVFAMVRQTTDWSIRKSYRLNGFICGVNIYSHLMQLCSLQNVAVDWLWRWWWCSAFSLLLLCVMPWKDDSYVTMAKVCKSVWRFSVTFQTSFQGVGLWRSLCKAVKNPPGLWLQCSSGHHCQSWAGTVSENYQLMVQQEVALTPLPSGDSP